jgi:hypothetical protein
LSLSQQIEPQEEYHLSKDDKYDKQYSLPVLVGPQQDRSWVKQLQVIKGTHQDLFIEIEKRT